MVRKILLIGRASVGKTSIKKVIFEGKNPKDLMIHPLEPTRGITSSIYSWMDLELALFDSSGQELFFLLEDEKEQTKAFDNTDIVVYIFDYPLWASNSQEIKEEIKKIKDFLKKKYFDANFLVFFHKIDLINKKFRDKFKLLKSQVQNILNLPENIKIYFTSIHPFLIYNTYNAFSEILSSFSTETAYLKDILDTTIKDFPKTIGFVINQNDNIIVQSMTNDFDINLINQLHKKTSELNQATENNENKILIDKRIQFIDLGSNILSIIKDNLNDFNPNLKNIIIFSEDLSKDKLFDLIEKLRAKLSKRYIS